MAKRKKILLVDDSRPISELIAVIIAEKDIDIITAVSGKEGWEKFKKYQPIDLVITDLAMENPQAGWVLARQIKEMSPGTPVIMISGTITDTKEKMGVDHLFPKPFDIKTLREVVKKFLERR